MPRGTRPLLLAALLLATLPAAAHPDIVVVDDALRLAPGRAQTFPVELHYHRLVGEVRADGPVAVLVRPAGGAAEVVAGPGEAFPVNALVACCKGEGWAAYEVVVENRAGRTVAADVRLEMLHDGVAVLGDNAESGAVEFGVVLFGGAALVFLSRMRRPVSAPPAETRRFLSWSAGLFAALWGLAAALAAYGMLRYGGGPVAGTLAATADLPSTGNIIITTHSLVTLAFMALAVAATGAWAGAVRRAGERRIAVGVLGVVLGAGALLACAAWAVEYGRVAAPLVQGLVSAALPLAGGIVLLARGRARGAARPPNAAE